MGNCVADGPKENSEKIGEAKPKSSNIMVLTFSGPNAFEAPSNDTMQATFSDPVFFTSASYKSSPLNN